ncbi:MAG: hypothetical protein KC912_17235 [Proteobacteria bacterium]|nr:hypothetical protein [Pseudomonadota bacterium]
MRPLALPLTVVLSATLLSGCVLGADKYPRPRDLAPSTLVDRTRVMAIQAEPPEAVPGQVVTFDVLLADPDGVIDLTVWLACAEADGFGCDTDLSGLDDATPEELAAAGVIGLQPFNDPVLQVPTDVLDALTEDEKQEGLGYTIQVAAFPTSDDTGAEIDFNDVEVAYKRLVVSEANTPNHNPTLRDWRVDGALTPAGSVVVVDAGQSYELSVLLAEGSVEDYEFINSSGVLENRTEQPYLAWYATSGTVGDEYTVPLNGYDAPLESTWTAPDEAQEGRWYVVVRDRRGGQSWLIQDFRVQ